MEKYVESHYVEMSDGKKLYTVVIKPKKEGRFPVVMERCPYATPYNESVTAENCYTLNYMMNYVFPRDELITAGYCYVYQHVRGSGNSTGGEIYYAKYEHNDARDTMEWLRKQDFYSGEIYRYGASYTGMSAIIDACEHYPDLKGIISLFPGSPPAQLMLHNGFIRNGLGTGWEVHQAKIQRPAFDHSYSFDTYRTFPQKDQRRLIFGDNDECGRMLSDAQAHPDERDTFWISSEGPGASLYRSYSELDVPTLFATGWYCHLVDHMLNLWNNVISAEARKKSTLLITPYAHNVNNKREDWPFNMEGASNAEAYPHFIVNWLNNIRSGEPLELLKTNRVCFFPECGQKNWFYEEVFTNGECVDVLFLNENRKLETVPGKQSEITYTYNPFNPAIYYEGVGRNIGFIRPVATDVPLLSHPLCPQDPPNWRYDVISFTAEPFDKETFIKGNMSADLHVKSDCEDTCFYARIHLEKDGVTYGLRDDITSLCRQLDNYIPGDEAKLHFEFPPIAWAVQPGDTLRIDVTSSSFPNYSVHTNVKGLQAEVEKPKYAQNTIICGKSSLTYHTSALSSDDYEIVKVEDKNTTN